MDPVSALGVGSAAIQFLDYVSELLTKSVEVYKSSGSSTGDYQDLDTVTKDLSQFNQRVIKSAQTGGAEHSEIGNLCQPCNEVANELLRALENVRKRDSTRWESFRIALRTVRTENEIASLQKRVDGYRQQISLQILIHIE
jgi:hypothetical protein